MSTTEDAVGRMTKNGTKRSEVEVVTLVDNTRPWTANAERRWHHMKRAKEVSEARARWYWLARMEQAPLYERVIIEATPLQKNRRWEADVAACYPTVKAAIDGLVDAGVLGGDTPAYVHQIIFNAAQVADCEGLRLTITPVEP